VVDVISKESRLSVLPRTSCCFWYLFTFPVKLYGDNNFFLFYHIPFIFLPSFSCISYTSHAWPTIILLLLLLLLLLPSSLSFKLKQLTHLNSSIPLSILFFILFLSFIHYSFPIPIICSSYCNSSPLSNNGRRQFGFGPIS
jgi:uncharacterized membrane protein YhaH (DUF805 family)